MVDSRTLTALFGLAGSLAISVAAWYYFDTLLVFLVIPFVPLLFRGLSSEDGSEPPVKECPTCGFTTRASEVHFCPRDGSELRER